KNKAYVPHNYNYMSEEEKAKFEGCVNTNKDIIEEFMASKNKIKPLEEYLKELESEDNEYDSDSNSNSDSDIPDISVPAFKHVHQIPMDTTNDMNITSITNDIKDTNDECDHHRLRETIDKARSILS